MKKKIAFLKKKKKSVIEHEGIKKVKLKRITEKKELAKNQPLAQENKKEYALGCALIVDILKYKQKNPLIYFTGKQADAILKKYPKINTPEGVKSILVASVNPNLTTSKVNSMVSRMFSSNFPENERKKIIVSMIRNIKAENYNYLL